MGVIGRNTDAKTVKKERDIPTLMPGAPRKMAIGMKNMFATTWSSASATKVAVGHHIAMICPICQCISSLQDR